MWSVKASMKQQKGAVSLHSLCTCRGRVDIYMEPASVTVVMDIFVFLVGSNVQDESIDRRDESAETESWLYDHDESDTDASDGILDEKDTVLGRLSPSSTSCCDDGITAESNL